MRFYYSEAGLQSPKANPISDAGKASVHSVNRTVTGSNSNFEFELRNKEREKRKRDGGGATQY
jgi:hypothetical protein